jgi:hypothetical protein
LSNTIDRYLDDAWKSRHKLFGDPSPSLSAPTHNGSWFMKHDLKDFLYTATSLTDNMSAEDPANAKVYQERAVKYQYGLMLWTRLTASRLSFHGYGIGLRGCSKQLENWRYTL